MAESKPKKDDEDQSERFVEKAKEIVGENADDEFEHALKWVVPVKRRPEPKPNN